ncbi:MPN domain-containing protein isoform X3 [Bos taurus]|uniref:MPN domain-containing protein isoform X3 n=1 Tax=Bos taurus TaxID=9913 RepID=UPI0028CB2C00|nr:MPN domain-containing protein isoform X3 [Bos taurus]
MAEVLPPRGGAASRAGKKEPEAHRARGVGRNDHGSLSLPVAPEPLSPAGAAGEEAPDEDEDEAEAEDPERPGASGGARGGGGGGGAGPGSCGGPGGALTRRAVTLRVLLKDALLEPGAGVLSIYYLGKKFVGDLQPDGRIVWQETGQVFNSPSAWATHCKKLVNPAKKSGCGWASVKYKGQKLDKYKAAWLRRNQLHMTATAADESPASEGEEEEPLIEEEEEEVLTAASADDKSRRPQGKGPSEPVHSEATPPGKRVDNKIRVPVRYCMLGSRDSARNPHTLVEVTSFAAINKFQPFNVAVSSNVLFLLCSRCSEPSPVGAGWGTRRPQPPWKRRSTRACSCAACPWWAGTTATRIARRYRRCRTSISRWTTSCGCRAPATVSSPASPCSAPLTTLATPAQSPRSRPSG